MAPSDAEEDGLLVPCRHPCLVHMRLDDHLLYLPVSGQLNFKLRLEIEAGIESIGFTSREEVTQPD
jgi:hypothetical protein